MAPGSQKASPMQEHTPQDQQVSPKQLHSSSASPLSFKQRPQSAGFLREHFARRPRSLPTSPQRADPEPHERGLPHRVSIFNAPTRLAASVTWKDSNDGADLVPFHPKTLDASHVQGGFPDDASSRSDWASSWDPFVPVEEKLNCRTASGACPPKTKDDLPVRDIFSDASAETAGKSPQDLLAPLAEKLDSQMALLTAWKEDYVRQAAAGRDELRALSQLAQKLDIQMALLPALREDTAQQAAAGRDELRHLLHLAERLDSQMTVLTAWKTDDAQQAAKDRDELRNLAQLADKIDSQVAVLTAWKKDDALQAAKDSDELRNLAHLPEKIDSQIAWITAWKEDAARRAAEDRDELRNLRKELQFHDGFEAIKDDIRSLRSDLKPNVDSETVFRQALDLRFDDMQTRLLAQFDTLAGRLPNVGIDELHLLMADAYSVIKEVRTEVPAIKEVRVEVPVIREVENVVEVIKEVPVEVIKEVRVEVEKPVEIVKEVEKIVQQEVIKEVPVEVIKEVVKEVPVEVIKEVVKEVPVEVIKEVVKELPVEVIKEVGKIVEVEKIVEVPIEVVKEKIVKEIVKEEVIKEVPVEVRVEVEVEKPVKVEVEKIVYVEKFKEVPTEVIKEVEKRVEVPVVEVVKELVEVKIPPTIEELVKILAVVHRIEDNGNIIINWSNGDVDIKQPIRFKTNLEGDLKNIGCADENARQHMRKVLQDIAQVCKLFPVPVNITGHTKQGKTESDHAFPEKLACARAVHIKEELCKMLKEAEVTEEIEIKTKGVTGTKKNSGASVTVKLDIFPDFD